MLLTSPVRSQLCCLQRMKQAVFCMCSIPHVNVGSPWCSPKSSPYLQGDQSGECSAHLQLLPLIKPGVAGESPKLKDFPIQSSSFFRELFVMLSSNAQCGLQSNQISASRRAAYQRLKSQLPSMQTERYHHSGRFINVFKCQSSKGKTQLFFLKLETWMCRFTDSP